MQKKLFAILQYAFFLGIGFFLVWWQLKSMTPEEQHSFYNALSQANYWLIIPASFIMLLSHLSRAMRWKLPMRPLNYNPSLGMVFASTMVGYLANSAIPRLGEILKCSLLAKYEKLRIDKLFGTILVERIFDFVCFLIFSGMTILIQLDTVGQFIKKILIYSNNDGNGGTMYRYLYFLLFIAALLYLIKYLAGKYPGSLLVRKTQSLIQGIKEGIGSILTLKAKREFMVHTVIIWALYLLQIYIGFYAMPATSGLPVAAAFTVLSLATVAMIVTPGGIGSFPIFVMQALALYHIDDPVGKAFGWLMWGVNTGIIILAGCISLLAIPYLQEKKNKSNLPDFET